MTNNALRPEMHRLSQLIVCHVAGAFATSSCRLTYWHSALEIQVRAETQPRPGIVIIQQLTG